MLSFGLVFGIALIGGQGLLLADMLGMRSAPWLWLLSTAVFAVAGYVTPDPSRALAQVNYVLSVVLSTVIIGGVYGAVYGAVLVLMVKMAARKARPVAVLEGQGEPLVRP
jgi:hypothetical protein